jgi:hypothetical protein
VGPLGFKKGGMRGELAGEAELAVHSGGGTRTRGKEGGVEGCLWHGRKRTRGKGAEATQRPLFKATWWGFEGGPAGG